MRDATIFVLFNLFGSKDMGDFIVGTVVRLKSGGPAMTIASISTSGVLCVWFDKNSEAKTGNFPPETLELAEGK